jgi:hypothetical protein
MSHSLKFFVLLFLVLVFSAGTKAQGNYEDVVYLKNGGIIHGIIIEQVLNESIKIRTKDRNVFVFRMEEVLKITKEESAAAPKPDVRTEKEAEPEESMKQSGYTNILEFTFGRDQLRNHSNNALTGSTKSTSQMSIGIQDINGYLFNPHLSTGIGIGLHFYPGMVLVPLFADVRYNFTKTPVTPFVALGAGYSFTYMEVFGFESTKDYFGGPMLNPSFGVKFTFRSGKAFQMNLGYRYQETRIYTHNSIFSNSHPYRTDGYQGQTLGYTNFKFGFVF